MAALSFMRGSPPALTQGEGKRPCGVTPGPAGGPEQQAQRCRPSLQASAFWWTVEAFVKGSRPASPSGSPLAEAGLVGTCLPLGFALGLRRPGGWGGGSGTDCHSQVGGPPSAQGLLPPPQPSGPLSSADSGATSVQPLGLCPGHFLYQAAFLPPVCLIPELRAVPGARPVHPGPPTSCAGWDPVACEGSQQGGGQRTDKAVLDLRSAWLGPSSPLLLAPA